MIFHIAICSPDGALRSRLEHQCMEFFARREDACIVEQLQGPDALLQQDAAGLRYELYLIELAAVARPEGLTAAAALRRRGRRTPLAFVARTSICCSRCTRRRSLPCSSGRWSRNTAPPLP